MDKKQTLAKRLVWTGRKSIGAGLLLVVVLVGMLLLNPAVFSSQIDEESQQTFADGTILKHSFSGDPDTGRLRAILSLESFQGEADEERSFIDLTVRLRTIDRDAVCERDAFRGRVSGSFPYNKIRPYDPLPARISDVEADSHDSGKLLCYHVNISGLYEYDYYYSTGVVPEIKAKTIPERPVLSFDQSSWSRSWSTTTNAQSAKFSLSLKTINGYPGRLPSRTAMIVQWKVVEQKSDCQAAAFTAAANPNLREDDHHKIIHVQTSPSPLWHTASIVLDTTSQFACWRVWVDPERDNQNWQAYYYAGPRLPRAWSTAGPALAGDGNTTFKFSLVDETEASYRIGLVLTQYGGYTGKLAQPLKYSLKAKPVYRQSDCDAENFVKPGESLDYIEKTGDTGWLSHRLIDRPLPDPNAYSQKFLCFRVVITPDNAGWYQIAQGYYQTYYYVSERLPEMSGPAFNHWIKTRAGHYPELTLRLQSLGEKTNSYANITRIIVGRVDHVVDCYTTGGRIVLDTPISVRPPADLVTTTLDSSYDGKFTCFSIQTGDTYYHHVTERIELDLPEPASKWTIKEAVSLFKRQLTNEGLRALQGVEIIVSPNGCHPDYNDQAAGCWVQHEQKIYIHDDYFPEGYATQSQDTKLNIMKNTLDVLAHETNHAIETYRKDLGNLIYDCFEAVPPPSVVSYGIQGWFTNRRYNYQERLDTWTEACLLEDPIWGEIVKALKAERDRHDWAPDWSSGSEAFSANWYVEFYAELPTRAPVLLNVLENHYDQYYKDRSQFADVIENRRIWFD